MTISDLHGLGKSRSRIVDVDVHVTRTRARFVLAFALAGCGAPPPIATAADAERAHVELAQLADGRALLLGKCGSCHDVPRPDEKPRALWPKQVADMQQKAGLDAPQRALIEQYLVVMAPK